MPIIILIRLLWHSCSHHISGLSFGGFGCGQHTHTHRDSLGALTNGGKLINYSIFGNLIADQECEQIDVVILCIRIKCSPHKCLHLLHWLQALMMITVMILTAAVGGGSSVGWWRRLLPALMINLIMVVVVAGQSGPTKLPIIPCHWKVCN